MRNVPVGAGRRKTKSSSSHCHHITISDTLQATRIDAPIGFHHPAFEPNGTLLSFGGNSLLCVPDNRTSNGNTNYESDRGDTNPCNNGGDSSIGSSVIAKNSTTDGGQIAAQNNINNINAFQSPLPSIPTPPWAIPWNSAVTVPAIYPIPVFPAAYWNCTMPNAWNIPWLSITSPSANQSSGPSSPLGKHSRKGELLNLSDHQHTKPETSENSILIPKTLRIDDPEEAAKSSIWETLGIKYDSTTREGLFNAFQPKGDEKNLAASPSPALQANPAALSRSINFREGV